MVVATPAWKRPAVVISHILMAVSQSIRTKILSVQAKTGTLPILAQDYSPFAWYNFVQVHSSLRVTPAMEAGIADQVWELRDLLN